MRRLEYWPDSDPPDIMSFLPHSHDDPYLRAHIQIGGQHFSAMQPLALHPEPGGGLMGFTSSDPQARHRAAHGTSQQQQQIDPNLQQQLLAAAAGITFGSFPMAQPQGSGQQHNQGNAPQQQHSQQHEGQFYEREARHGEGNMGMIKGGD